MLGPEIQTSTDESVAREIFLTKGKTTEEIAMEMSASEMRSIPNVRLANMFEMVESDLSHPIIGTYGMAVCVGVSIWQETTKKAVVIHFDPTQEVESNILEMIKQVGGNTNTRRHVFLVAGTSFLKGLCILFENSRRKEC